MNQLYRDVIAAIDLVPKFNHDAFDMLILKHPCGTPSCAKGNIWALDIDLATRLTEFTMGENNWHALFGGSLQKTIKTPEEWRDHAIAWLAGQGIDYYEHGAKLEPKLDLERKLSEKDIAIAAEHERAGKQTIL